MRFSDYIAINNIAVSDAANALGVTHQAVYAWMNGRRLPSSGMMAKIFNWSNQQVTPNDFYDLPQVQRAARANGDVCTDTTDLFLAGVSP